MSDAAAVNPLSAAVIVAGGRGSRMGGRDKPGLLVGDRSLLTIAIDAAGDCPIVVVGPARDLPVGVLATTEEPAGGGPAAGVAAGVAALPPLPTGALIAVLAADLPGIDRRTLQRLAGAIRTGPATVESVAVGSVSRGGAADGAVLVDVAGRRQNLIGVWRADRLAAAIAMRPHWHGAPLHALLSPLTVLEIRGRNRETDDVDTPDDWRRWQS
jgi:molybdopterin-guanine dinucleotide biosynthesis protein A